MILLHHQTFGYFTGLGWTAHKAEAKPMDLDVAAGWKRLMLEIAQVDASADFSPRAIRFVGEAEAEVTVSAIPLSPHRDQRIDPPAWFRH